MGPTALSDALEGLPKPNDPNLLVGIETADDAAVYRLSDEIAMINTVDFITPPVDDPYWFGQISAANSISDVYSMGGRPITALNVVMFPSKQLDMGLLKDILRGGHDKVVEAGACLVGGHTVDDEEPKYGLCVNGIVHPDRIITNAGSRPGDVLILTKPLGSGVLFNATRSGKFPYADLEKDILPALAALNGPAMEAALKFELHACTDITGFGILGHLLEVAHGSDARVILYHKALPFFPGALAMYKKGETTGSNKANRAMVSRHHMKMGVSLSSAEEELLYDPQTSGGLLLSVPASQGKDVIASLHQAGVAAAVQIGEVVDAPVGIDVM
ncbi:MAG: selenide, water dikinase SelD [Proteobacteria bacterium]|nr:selenide, water dikinase SelD [Pseudomonadota bacterium]MBU1709342.1 selenide, water dikinase SelD [Pseudomonadota bacterium]